MHSTRTIEQPKATTYVLWRTLDPLFFGLKLVSALGFSLSCQIQCKMDDRVVVRNLLGRGGSLQQQELLGIIEDADVDLDAIGFMHGLRGRPRSALTEALLYMFGWGLLSGPLVQWLAACGVEGQKKYRNAGGRGGARTVEFNRNKR